MRKQNFTIDVPQIACITVTGPTKCGKSIVIARIKKMLEQDFGATVVSKDWTEERKLSGQESLEDWERKIVAGTIWSVSEPVPPIPSGIEEGKCNYPHCSCPFDMGPDHQCLKGLPVIRK